MTTKILSLGDSWFHYPKGFDRDGNIVWFPAIQEALAKGKGVGNIPYYLKHKFVVGLNYFETTLSEAFDSAENDIHSNDDNFGICGEELMVMVYGYRRQNPEIIVDSTTWLQLLIKRIENYDKTHGLDRVILLLSGGGNDMVDKNLPDFLEIDVATGKGQLKINFLRSEVTKLKKAWEDLFVKLYEAFPNIQFHYILHGYDHPPVNGRGLITTDAINMTKLLQRLSPGPWLSPYLNQYGITARNEAEEIVAKMINEYNAILPNLVVPTNGQLHYVDLRGIGSNPSKDECWANELHLDREHFIMASQKYYSVIAEIIAS